MPAYMEYVILSYIFTFIGLAALSLWCWRDYRKTKETLKVLENPEKK